MNALAPAVPSTQPEAWGDLVAHWLGQYKPTTAKTYRGQLAAFARWSGLESSEAVFLLLGRGRGSAHALAMSWRAAMLGEASPATINVRLATLRSLVSHARRLGLVEWHLELDGVRQETLRDTRGPGVEGFRSMLAELSRREASALHDRELVKARRDRAIVWLLFGLALRRAEVVSLDVEHVDGDRLWVLGKGHHERQAVTMPAPVRGALAGWLACRGETQGAVFLSLANGYEGRRLSPNGVCGVVTELGSAVGLTVRPHGLRHAAITTALDRTRGDVRAVQRFSRHADVRTLQRYDDNRTDMGGEVAKLVCGHG